jgi:hypothetical protein
MAVFYNREKSKIGTTTGSIINWSRQLTSNDPEDTTIKTQLPAGYLRCDGSIYAAEIFPALAEVLGTGQQSRFRKPNQTLLDNQFQLPDFGSKKIRASSGANLGDYVDLYIEDDSNNTITKSGVGLEVQSNIGTRYEILYQGSFFLPGQTIPVTGEPGFTRSTGNYTETTDVQQNAFIPHAHFHDGNRTRVASSTGNEYASFGRNSYIRKSTLCVIDWANNTRQDLCYYNATRVRLSTVVQQESNAANCRRTYYAGCFSGCEFTSSYECLIPSGYTCAFPIWSGSGGGCPGSGSQETATCGNIQYQGTVAVKCESVGFPGCAIGGFIAQPRTGPITLPSNYDDSNVPFDSFKDSDQNTFAAINNVTNQVEVVGNDGSHRHFVNFSAEPHTYQVNTRPTFIPSANLISTISVDVNEENKADQFVQPYIVQEFLIKY